MKDTPRERETAPRGRYVGSAASANDNDPLAVTLTRAELAEVVRTAVTQAVGGASRLVDKQELAALLLCSPAHVDHLRKRGLPWVPVGQAVRFEPARVIDWLREQQPNTKSSDEQ
jgi:hypothetical protein